MCYFNFILAQVVSGILLRPDTKNSSKSKHLPLNYTTFCRKLSGRSSDSDFLFVFTLDDFNDKFFRTLNLIKNSTDFIKVNSVKWIFILFSFFILIDTQF